MKVVVKQLIGWKECLDLARETANLPPIDKEPSGTFIRDMIMAEHSPIRAVTYKIQMFDIPYWVSVHLVRHKYGVEHFVGTQRTDRTGVPREKMPQDTPVHHTMILNAQEILFISRRRLCTKASTETRKLWSMVVAELGKVDPILADWCVPMCIYKGGCFEKEGCGYYTGLTKKMKDKATLLCEALERHFTRGCPDYGKILPSKCDGCGDNEVCRRLDELKRELERL